MHSLLTAADLAQLLAALVLANVLAQAGALAARTVYLIGRNAWRARRADLDAQKARIEVESTPKSPFLAHLEGPARLLDARPGVHPFDRTG